MKAKESDPAQEERDALIADLVDGAKWLGEKARDIMRGLDEWEGYGKPIIGGGAKMPSEQEQETEGLREMLKNVLSDTEGSLEKIAGDAIDKGQLNKVKRGLNEAKALIRRLDEAQQANYSNMLQGKPTNALAKTSKKRASADAMTGTGEITTADSVKVFIQNFNSVALNVNTHKVLDALTLELTNNFPHGKETTIEQVDKHRAITLSVDDYMALCGLKDKKEARKQLKEAMQTLYNLSLEWSEVHYYVPKGKKRRVKEEMHAQARIMDFMGHDLKQNPIKNGRVYAKFTMDIAKYLSRAYIMPYPDKLLSVNSKRNPHSYYIGRKLAEHHNMNIGKANANRISVKALVGALPDLPSYDEIISTVGKNVTQQIIQPFERDLAALKDKYGVLASWKYCNGKGKPLTEEQIEDYSHSTWEQWLVEYELADYPDQSERLAKMAKRRKASAKRRSQNKPDEQQRNRA